MSEQITIEDCIEEAKKHNGRCLSIKYIPGKKQKWKCKKGHIWFRKFSQMIRNHQWCRRCAYDNLSLGINTAKKIALDRKGECLSDRYINYSDKLLWKCKHGHIWRAALRRIKSNKTWCPECNRQNKMLDGLKEALDIASRHKGLCLSTVYINSNSKLLWKCEKGHTWSSTLTHIKHHKSWCPVCKLYKSQKLLQSHIESILNMKSIANFRGFPWLKNKRLLEIDIWVPKIKMAIEFDGPHHFIPIKFKKYSNKQALEKLKYIKNNDKIKNHLILSHPKSVKYFIRIPYTTKLDIENIKNILKEQINNKEEGKC